MQSLSNIAWVSPGYEGGVVERHVVRLVSLPPKKVLKNTPLIQVLAVSGTFVGHVPLHSSRKGTSG